MLEEKSLVKTEIFMREISIIIILIYRKLESVGIPEMFIFSSSEILRNSITKSLFYFLVAVIVVVNVFQLNDAIGLSFSVIFFMVPS